MANHTRAAAADRDTSWMADGRCATAPTGTMFPETGGAAVANAIRVCKNCPVRERCLEYALINNIDYGIWGGESERARRRIRVARKKAAARGDVQVLDAPRAGISGTELAETLGVYASTVHRWAPLLGYPPVGSGRRRVFTDTDLLICRAWQVICGEKAYYHHGTERALCDQAAAAIRRRPARWLIVTPHCGFTHPEAEDATRLALQLDLRCWWLIDLWSRRG